MGRPKGSISKDRIISAVENLIAAKGVKNFSLRDVSTKANLSPGTIYYHYATKDELVFDVISRHIESLKEEYLQWLSRHENDLHPQRFLEVVFHKSVKLFDRAKMHIFLINECLGGNEILRAKFIEKYREWRSTLLIGVKKVFAHLEDDEAFAYTLMLIIDGLVVQEILQDNGFDENRLVKIMMNVGDKK
ncbi:MAG: TetR/AcrR family transcriptional regulator [Erysipelotrichia bacterium]|jgi:AcrR family transcriptional regulator|nr:TetR/AcrR family transcriptional regulator [Bacilli bacterium]MDD4005622.1 TetR/AcrR family transcriptional regulator [Bacilli bacterium]NMV82017.1 TetR/AcrR family transcriptional regulator [Erysipelotrichia bacterium]